MSKGERKKEYFEKIREKNWRQEEKKNKSKIERRRRRRKQRKREKSSEIQDPVP